MSASVAQYLLPLSTFPGDAAIGYRHRGIRGVWAAFASRTVFRCFHAGRLVVIAQEIDRPPVLSVPDGIVFEPLTEARCNDLIPLAGRLEVRRFSRWLTLGRHCVVAWRGSVPVGYGWVVPRMGPEDFVWPVPFELPQDAAYLCNLYVLPGERGNGLGSALSRARLRKAWELGYRAGWRMIAVSNAASIRTVHNSSLPARLVGHLRYVKLFGRAYSRFLPSM
jgi:GNAT superfamily N-acetyltransferase